MAAICRHYTHKESPLTVLQTKSGYKTSKSHPTRALYSPSSTFFFLPPRPRFGNSNPSQDRSESPTSGWLCRGYATKERDGRNRRRSSIDNVPYERERGGGGGVSCVPDVLYPSEANRFYFFVSLLARPVLITQSARRQLIEKLPLCPPPSLSQEDILRTKEIIRERQNKEKRKAALASYSSSGAMKEGCWKEERLLFVAGTPLASSPPPILSAPGIRTPTPRSARLPRPGLGPASLRPW